MTTWRTRIEPFTRPLFFAWSRSGSPLQGALSGFAFGLGLDRIAMMNGIKRLEDFDLIVLVSAGFPGAKGCP